MKILVADDEDACQGLLRDVFASEPEVELTFARDGADAWWKLTEPHSKFDLGIIDVKMPGVDGLQFIERVRSVVTLRHFPVVLCTGMSDRDTVARAAKLRIAGYIVKPYMPANVRDKIRSLGF